MNAQPPTNVNLNVKPPLNAAPKRSIAEIFAVLTVLACLGLYVWVGWVWPVKMIKDKNGNKPLAYILMVCIGVIPLLWVLGIVISAEMASARVTVTQATI